MRGHYTKGTRSWPTLYPSGDVVESFDICPTDDSEVQFDFSIDLTTIGGQLETPVPKVTIYDSFAAFIHCADLFARLGAERPTTAEAIEALIIDCGFTYHPDYLRD